MIIRRKISQKDRLHMWVVHNFFQCKHGHLTHIHTHTYNCLLIFVFCVLLPKTKNELAVFAVMLQQKERVHYHTI